jgi:hypothetical protein
LETTNGLKVRLDARSISPEFTANLGKTSLDEVFQVGQLFAFKVLKSAKQKSNHIFPLNNYLHFFQMKNLWSQLIRLLLTVT